MNKFSKRLRHGVDGTYRYVWAFSGPWNQISVRLRLF